MALTHSNSVAMTVTNLHSLAADANYLTGWTSDGIDCKAGTMTDVLLSVQFVSHASNRQAGTMYIYTYGAISKIDSSIVWPDIFSSGTEGTQGAATVTDTEFFGSALNLVAAVQFDTGASDVGSISQIGLAQFFGGALPPTNVAIFITGNIASSTNAQLASSGNVVAYTPIVDA